MDNQNNDSSVPSPQTPVEEEHVVPGENGFGPSMKVVEKPDERIHVQTQKTKTERTLNIDELLRSFIGPNYDKFLMKPFNFAAFIFTFMYYFYRKMTFFGIIILIVEGVLSYYFMTMPYVLLIVNVLCGFLTNKIYANFALRKIHKSLIANAGKSIDYVKGACSVLGGRSLKRVFTTIVLLVLSSIPISMIIIYLNLSTDFKNFINNFDFMNLKMNNFKLPNVELENKFSGYIVIDKSSKILDVFDVNVPSVFAETQNNNEYSLEYSFKSNNKEYGTCTYSLKGVSGYTSSKNLINDMREYYKDKNPSEVQEKYINRIFWNTFNYQTENANIYYYACNKGTKVYLYVFADGIESTGSCHNYVGSVLNDIVLK